VKELARNLGLVLFGVTVSLLLFEAFAWFMPRPWLPVRLRELGETMERNRRADSFLIPDKELLFKIAANTDFIVKHPDYTFRLKTNLNLGGIGFRGGILGGPPWGVAVGDSFTFGQGVEHEETWSSRLATTLGREVVNFGIPAQGPAQYTRVLKRYALPLRPRVAFYGVYFNDLDSAARFRRMKSRLIPVSRYLRNFSYTYNLFRGIQRAPAIQPVFVQTAGSEFDLSSEGLRSNLERQKRNFDERWQLMLREIEEGRRASAEAQVAFVLFYFPSRWEVHWDVIKKQVNWPANLDIDRFRRAVVQYCTTEKISCLDLTPALKQAASQGRQLYFRLDGHWNREGNRVVAEAIREYLVATGMAQ
jgi:lysophospholipase L1-like esterase